MKKNIHITLFIWSVCFCISPCFCILHSQPIINQKAIKDARIIEEKMINSANIETSPAFIGDKIGFVFTTQKSKLFDSQIDEAFFEMATSQVNLDNSLAKSEIFNKKFNSDLHEGPMSYDLNLNKLYFTRSHKDKRTSKGATQDTTYLRIMTADLNASNPGVKPININVERYSVCHPSLSKDGKSMVFASNKPDGQGGYDLYMAYLNGTEWEGIINLGPSINSANHEVFPYLLNDSIIIFSSQRQGGVGGLDLYVSKLKDGTWSEAEIMPKPFNSSFDDLGLIVRENMKSGYMASNRAGGQGKDDIYRFESQEPIFGSPAKILVNASANIMDKLTLEGIEAAQVSIAALGLDLNSFAVSSYNVDVLSGRDPGDLILKLSPKKGKSTPKYTTDDKGWVDFTIEKGVKYLVSASAKGYEDISLIFDFESFGDVFNMVMEPIASIPIEEIEKDEIDVDTISIPMETGKKIVFDKIYYDYGSAAIKKGASKELDLLASSMQSKPDMKIRLEAHTDSRGGSPFNMQLSIKRAEAARQYLVALGIDENRITIRGYGESQLRNECTDKVPCPDSKHAYNRRTEVIIE